MYVLIDHSELVATGFSASLAREGVPLANFRPSEFPQWLSSAQSADLQIVEAFLVGACDNADALSKTIRRYSRAPIIALRDQTTLESTLALFEAGADDVVRKPVNVRELLARVEAVRRRARLEPEATAIGRLKVFFDGRYPEIDDREFALPRRERRILEFLVLHRGKWVTKQQVFAATYGIFDDEVQESVVESHISKLRRKLMAALGHDPIESRRYLGYRIEVVREAARYPLPRATPREVFAY